MRVTMVLAAALALGACGVRSAVHEATSAPTIAPTDKPSVIGRALHRGASPAPAAGPDAEWTAEALAALNAEGVTLLSSMPRDVLQYCPGYAAAPPQARAAFWAGLIGSIAGSGEGTAAGKTSAARRLLHIPNPLARAHGCDGSMESGRDNLRCAVRILNRSVAQDNAIAGESTGARRGWLGAARAWTALRSAKGRADIAGFTRTQNYCR